MKNLHAIKFNHKSDLWVDKINSKDLEYGKPGWLDELLGSIPYREDVNFVVDLDLLR